MFQVTFSQQVKDGMQELASLERVPEDRFKRIVEFCRQSISLANYDDNSEKTNEVASTQQFFDYSKKDFLNLATCLNCFFVELVKHRSTQKDIIEILNNLTFSTTQTEQSSVSRNTTEILSAFNDLKPLIAKKLSHLSNDQNELERVVACTWTQSYIIPTTDEVVKLDAKDNADHCPHTSNRESDPKTIYQQSLLYTIQLKLDTGRSIQVECDEANLQDLVYTIRGCCKQLESLKTSSSSSK